MKNTIYFADNTDTLSGHVTNSNSVADSSTVATNQKVDFNPQNFVKNTSYMGKGMLGIFVAIAIIVVVTAMLGKIKSK